MQVLHGDCLEVLKTIERNSIDACICDPPYGLNFMGKAWDHGVPGTAYWASVYHALKPGGYLLAFGGTRTYHRLACAIEDAGFEVRDMVSWIYGSGFPKSLDVSKAIDKRGGNAGLTAQIGAAIKAAREARGMSAAECDRIFCGGTTNWSWFEGRPSGQRMPTPNTFAKIAAAWPELIHLAEAVAEIEREIVGKSAHRSGIGNGTAGHYTVGGTIADHYAITIPATDAAREWEGWGTALKPALEPICMARKPLGTGDIDVRRNVERGIRSHGWVGEIKWLDESVVFAASLKSLKASSGTQSSEETSVESVAAVPTGNIEQRTSSNSEKPLDDGMPTILKRNSTTESVEASSSEIKFSSTMARTANVAENLSQTSLPSIISTVAEQSTGRQSEEECMPTCGSEDSRPDTESFAGIVTGLTDSMENVHIRREGTSFVWPHNLPVFVDSKPLTVAANVLKWGTGRSTSMIAGCPQATTLTVDDTATISRVTLATSTVAKSICVA